MLPDRPAGASRLFQYFMLPASHQEASDVDEKSLKPPSLRHSTLNRVRTKRRMMPDGVVSAVLTVVKHDGVMDALAGLELMSYYRILRLCRDNGTENGNYDNGVI